MLTIPQAFIYLIHKTHRFLPQEQFMLCKLRALVINSAGWNRTPDHMTSIPCYPALMSNVLCYFNVVMSGSGTTAESLCMNSSAFQFSIP